MSGSPHLSPTSPPDATASRAHGDTLPQAAGPHPIQVIEDLPLVRRLLCDIIEEGGQYKVCALSDTEDGAVADFQAHRPAAVIVDLNLKQGSGLGFLNQVRRMNLDYRPALIVVTNHGIAALQAACKKAGADHFLDKSRDLVRLKAVIDDSLRERMGEDGANDAH
jgi:DNA-binding NarL/FixJ family response regulator